MIFQYSYRIDRSIGEIQSERALCRDGSINVVDIEVSEGLLSACSLIPHAVVGTLYQKNIVKLIS